MLGQTKIDQVVARGAIRPGESFGSSSQISASIDLDGVKPVRVHPRGIEHDIICGAIPEGVLDEGSQQ